MGQHDFGLGDETDDLVDAATTPLLPPDPSYDPRGTYDFYDPVEDIAAAEPTGTINAYTDAPTTSAVAPPSAPPSAPPQAVRYGPAPHAAPDTAPHATPDAQEVANGANSANGVNGAYLQRPRTTGAPATLSTSQPGATSGPSPSAPVSGPHPSLHGVYAEALDGAIALAYADGGELATLDGVGRRLVSRVRAHRTRASAPNGGQSGVGMMPGMGPLGAPSRPSQPWRPSSVPAISRPPIGRPSGVHGSSGSQPSYPSYPSFPGAMQGASGEEFADDMEGQSTQLLSAQSQRPNERSWRLDEGLAGVAWRRGEPFVVRGDDFQALARSGTAPDTETLNAAWHIAIPIFRPGSLTNVRPPTDLIGVLMLYRNDPSRQFTGREMELLPLHADRAARAIRQIELTHQYHSQTELLETFLDIGVNIHNLPQFYERLRDVVRYAVEAPTFGVLLDYVRHEPSLEYARHEVGLEFGERDGERIPQQMLAEERLPEWWQHVMQGQTVVVPAFTGPAARQGIAATNAATTRAPAAAPHEPGQQSADGAFVGWGGDQPTRSLLATPLLIGSKVIGALVVASPRPGVYSRERVHVFETLARGAAVIVENSRLSGDMQRTISLSRMRHRQLGALSNAVMTLNSSLEVDHTIQMLADQASLLTHAQVCDVYLLERDQQAMVERATNTPGSTQPPEDRARIPLAWHGLNSVLEGGAFALLDNLDIEWEEPTEIGQLLSAKGMVSCLALPITSQDGVIGVLFAYTPRSRHHFQVDEIGLLQGLASQGGSAISNAGLYQELQEAYEEQKALDRLKDEFILTVSHEFRTPLTAIEGYVTLISRHGHRLEQAKLSQFAAEIHQATTQLAGMISMLADANRMSNQPLQVTLRSTNLRAVANGAIATQSPEAKDRITLHIPEDLWARADDERLMLVFTNLIGNAIKYSPEQAPCTVYATIASRAELARQGRAHAQADGAPERWVVITVRDQGPGISPEDQTKLFQKFVRLTQSLTTAVRGTGLGLWICRQYVTAMGGDIWVESSLQQGSRFEFCLPLVAAPTNGV